MEELIVFFFAVVGGLEDAIQVEHAACVVPHSNHILPVDIDLEHLTAFLSANL